MAEVEKVEGVKLDLGEYSGEIVDDRPHGRGKLVSVDHHPPLMKLLQVWIQ